MVWGSTKLQGLCGRECFLDIPILGGRVDRADITDLALQGSSALEKTGGLDHGGHFHTLPRVHWSSSQSSLECPEQRPEEVKHGTFINMMEYSVAKL